MGCETNKMSEKRKRIYYYNDHFIQINMKKASKFDMWVDRSIARLMQLTDEMDLKIPSESPPGVREESLYLSIPSNAEASDFLSMNDWMNPMNDEPANLKEWKA